MGACLKRRVASAALIVVLQFFPIHCATVAAAIGSETAGDLLQYVLPAVTAGVVTAQRDTRGAVQFGAAIGTTLIY